MTNYKTTYNKSYALVVGIDNYDHLRELENAVRGAYAVSDLLEKKYGFEVTQISNEHATRELILGWFYSIAPQLDADDRIFIYFAGHGLTRPVPDDGQIGYIALTKTRENTYDNAIKMDDLLEEANMLVAKHVLVVLDACFSGLAFIRTRSSDEIPPSMLDPQKLVDTLVSRRVRYIITAGGVETVDDNAAPDGTYSLFTYHLLNALQGGLKESDRIFRAKDLALFLEERVGKNRRSRHKPNYGYFGEGDGDFVFEAPRRSLSLNGLPGCEIELDNLVSQENTGDIAILASLRRTARIRLLEQITTGQSGSSVWLVNATGRRPKEIHGLHYCKLYRTPMGNEAETYERVRQTSIGKYVPQLVDYTPVINGWMASLYSVAHQTTLKGSQPLSRLLHNNIAAAKSNIDKLAQILSAWNPPPAREQNSHPQLLVQRLLQRYMRGSDVVDEDISERIRSIIPKLDSTTGSMQFSDQVLPNPLAYLASADLWRVPRSISWPLGYVHGDLHSNNVICPEFQPTKMKSAAPAVIDFDNFEADSCIFFDIAYLELDLAMKMLIPSPAENRRLWLEASAYLAQSIKLPDYPPLPAQFLPLHVLILPLRNMAAQVVKQQPGDFDVAFWISRMAAGLSFARKRKVSNSERRLALLLAAQSLRKALDELGTSFEVSGQSLWVDWEENQEPSNEVQSGSIDQTQGT